MQVKKKPRNAAAKKIHKEPPKEKRTKKEQAEQPFLKRMIFGEERPDLTELEAGSTTILDILAPCFLKLYIVAHWSSGQDTALSRR